LGYQPRQSGKNACPGDFDRYTHPFAPFDGATSDIDWNREAVKYASELAASGFKDGIYVADCKLVTKKLVTAMNDAVQKDILCRGDMRGTDVVACRTLQEPSSSCLSANTLKSTFTTRTPQKKRKKRSKKRIVTN
jgi:hypothetical protein